MKSVGVGADSQDLPEPIAGLLQRFDLRGAFFGEIGPNPPGTFALFEPDNQPGSAIKPASKMQNQVLAVSGEEDGWRPTSGLYVAYALAIPPAEDDNDA